MHRRISLGLIGFAVAAGSLAFAPEGKDKSPASGEMPAGMSAEDMQACMEAGTPGEMHTFLAEDVGTWTGDCKMWMAPGMDPVENTCTMTITPMMDGRYFRTEMSGEMPDMGPFQGFGISGYDNVSEELHSTWVDNWSTGVMRGTGEVSPDKKTITWTYTYNCPVTERPTKLREVCRRTGKDTLVMEMHGYMPRSDKEYKMMEISFKRQKGGKAVTSAE